MNSHQPSAISHQTSWWRRASTGRDALIIVAATLLFYAIAGDHLALRSSIRYVESAREMVETGDWVVPQLNYVPYLEKPILTYWTAAASRWLFGPSMYATHLPALLAGLLSLWCTYLLARQLRDRAFALAASLTLLGSAFFLVMTTELTTDPLLAGFIALAWWAWWSAQTPNTERRTPNAIWLFWLALGLGMLTKGPIAIVLAAAAIAGFAWLEGGVIGVFRTLWAMHPLRGIAVIALVNLPWSLLIWQRDPRLLEYFYVVFNFQAFYSSQVNHTGPLWLYLGVIPAAFFPWPAQTLIALGCQIRAGFWPALRKRFGDVLGRREHVISDDVTRLRRYLLCVLLFPLLFLTISSSKLGTYVMPLFPAVAILLMDVVWDRLSTPPAWLRWTPMILATVLVVAALGAYPVLAYALPDEASRIRWAWWPILVPAVLALLIGNLWAALLAKRRQILRSFAIGGLGTALGLGLIVGVAHSVVRDLTSERVARLLRDHVRPDDVVIVDQELAHDYNFVYFLERPLIALGEARETGMGFFADLPERRHEPFPSSANTYRLRGENLNHPRLWSWDHFKATAASGTRVWLVGEDNLVGRLKADGVPMTLIDQAMNVHVFTNQPGTDGTWPRRPEP